MFYPILSNYLSNSSGMLQPAQHRQPGNSLRVYGICRSLQDNQPTQRTCTTWLKSTLYTCRCLMECMVEFEYKGLWLLAIPACCSAWLPCACLKSSAVSIVPGTLLGLYHPGQCCCFAEVRVNCLTCAVQSEPMCCASLNPRDHASRATACSVTLFTGC